MDPPAGHNLNFKNGNRSRMRANAVKMAISIKNKIRLELIKKLPLCVYNRRHGIKSFVFYNTKKVMSREIGRAHSELQSRFDLVCRLLLEKKKQIKTISSQR